MSWSLLAQHRGFAHQRLLPKVNRAQPDRRAGHNKVSECKAHVRNIVRIKTKTQLCELGFVGVA